MLHLDNRWHGNVGIINCDDEEDCIQGSGSGDGTGTAPHALPGNEYFSSNGGGGNNGGNGNPSNTAGTNEEVYNLGGSDSKFL